MAEASQAPPSFKLVLVGDGGTGKVSGLQKDWSYCAFDILLAGNICPVFVSSRGREANCFIDHLRQATFVR